MTVEIQCIDLVKRYGKTPVLDRLNWTIADGPLVGLLGESGAGKTTLLRLIAALDGPSAGKVSVAGHQGSPVGMVFQNLSLWPHLTARRHVECVLWRIPRRQRRDRAEAVLAETRLPKRFKKVKRIKRARRVGLSERPQALKVWRV